MDVEALAFRNLSLAKFSSQYGWLELGPQSSPMTIWISTETTALRYSADLTVSGQSITSISPTADSATQIGAWHAAILAPTTTFSAMTDAPLKVSSKFPNGYGDFAVQSSDGVVCYFPGPILVHTSTVFRDMFEMPSPEAKGEAFVKITEPINILEAFLAHLDPNALTPLIDPDTIEDLLYMADKYQVTKILLWFKQEATLRRSDLEAKTVGAPFVITHPILCLSIATRLNFKRIGRIALRELSTCSSKVFLDCIAQLNPLMLHYLYQLRNHRITLYQAYVAKLTEISEKGCEYCSGPRAEWIRKFVISIQDTPSWAKFKEAFNKGTKMPCRRCGTCWSAVFSDKVPVWEKEARQEDSKFPEWPVD